MSDIIPVIALHGGAGTILKSRMTPEREAAYHAGLRACLTAGLDVLQAGGSALDAVTAAVMALEDDPLFNAGRGAVYTTDARHEMDAAIMDGASYFTVYYKILLPLLKPAIVTCAILKGVGVYNEYYAANLYLQDANLKTIAIALYSFTGPMGSKYNLICAGVIITLLPMLILFLIFQKQIYSGIAAGSVKE